MEEKTTYQNKLRKVQVDDSRLQENNYNKLNARQIYEGDLFFTKINDTQFLKKKQALKLEKNSLHCCMV